MSPILESIGSVKGFGWGAFAAGGSFESIATVTVGSGGSATVTFGSIPATYTHLQVRGYVRNTAASGPRDVYMQVNGVTSASYRWHYLWGNGASAFASTGTTIDGTNGLLVGQSPSTNNLSSNFMPMVIDILDYTNTNKNKTVRTLAGFDANGTAPGGNINNEAGKAFFNSGLFISTNAITSLTFGSQSDNIAEYSSFALYGIKGA